MQLDKFMIAIILISIFSTGFFNLYVETNRNYGITPDEQHQEVFNQMSSTYGVTEEIAEDIKGAGVTEGQDNWDVGKTVMAGLNAIKVIFIRGLPMALSMVYGLVLLIPIPGYIIVGLQTMIILLCTFALIYLYFRYKPGD